MSLRLGVEPGRRVWILAGIDGAGGNGLTLRRVRLGSRWRTDKQERGEFVQAAPPSEPLVRCAGRFIVHILDPGLVERLVEVLDAVVHSLAFGRADSQPDEMHLFVELVGVGHDAVVGRFRVKLRAAESSARPAESADVAEQIQMPQRDLECLHAAHRESRHRPMVAIGDRAIRCVDHREQVADHHILKGAELAGEIGTARRILPLSARPRRS